MSQVLIVDPDAAEAATLASVLGTDTMVLPTFDHLRRHLEQDSSTVVVVVGPSANQDAALSFAEAQRVERPALGVILVRQRVETSVLRDALRSGVREVVGARQLSDTVEAVNRAKELAYLLLDGSGEQESAQLGERGTLLTVFAAKGGCGKTTMATNLAAVLADGGRRNVCLVDLDLAFGDVAIALQLFPAHSIADAIPMGGALDEEGIMSLLTPHSPGLSALVAPSEPGLADNIDPVLVANILTILRKRFDFVVVDSPPAFTDQVLAAFDQSDLIVLLTTLDIPALKNLKLSLETLDILNYPRDRWRVVLNRADSKVGLATNEVDKTLQIPVSVEVPSSRSVPASVNRGVPIVLDEPSHPVSQAIRGFAQEHIVPLARVKPGAIPTGLRTDRRGLLRRKVKHA